jgi:predicted glycosyl hydrolase (DUF1957 family)
VTYWAQLLHFYQPPTQTHEVLRRVADESYRPLLRVLRAHPNARVAININGVLTDLLQEHGLGDVLKSMRELAERGQVEFVGSGKFHPILPLIPEAERKRAIAENARTNLAAFGDAWKPRGFFPPEMCCSGSILPSIAHAGHEWVVVSGVACPAEWPINIIYRVPADSTTMHVLFRDDSRSNRISFRETDPAQFLADVSRVGGGGLSYVLTAMDAETYGHHLSGWENEFLGATLTAIAAQPKKWPDAHTSAVHMVLPSDLLRLIPDGAILEPLDSSWSTSHEDMAKHNPYPLWNSPDNAIHKAQWEYVELCNELLAVAHRYAHTDEARKYADLASEKLQPALHSCQFWWASKRPIWDVTMIHRGFLLLNEVAVYASKAVYLGGASDRVKRDAHWRLAAANEVRAQLERELIEGAP